MKKRLAIAALAVAAAFSAQAAEPSSEWHFLVGTGLTFGGDKLNTTVTYKNGNDVNLRAGELIALYAGLDFRFANRFSLQTTIGYHVDDRTASNGDVTFDRVPIELLGYYGVTDQVRLGGGVRYVESPKLSGSGIASGTKGEFDNTTGAVLEGEYLFTPKFGLKIRGVSETYKLKGSSKSVNGSHAGVLVSYYF